MFKFESWNGEARYHYWKIAKTLGIHRNSVANKLNGITPFTVEEAFKIQAVFFPDLELKYLFKAESQEELFQKNEPE